MKQRMNDVFGIAEFRLCQEGCVLLLFISLLMH